MQTTLYFRNLFYRNISDLNNNTRLDYLDSVRGIASMMVVVYHYIGWRWEKEPGFHIASILFNGSDAVSFFFVLSGFVLSYRYFDKDEALELKPYLIKRCFRLYPAYIFTVLLNYAYWNRTLGIRVLSDAFYSNSQSLWEELLLIKNAHKFYIPGWTLGVELALSLLLPLLITAGKRNVAMIWALIPIAWFMGAGFITIFVIHFCLGMLLAYYLPQIQRYNFRQSLFYPYRWAAAIIVVILFSIRHIDRLHPVHPKIIKFMGFWGIDFFHFSGLASFLILLFVLNNQSVQQFLVRKPLRFIGKISYSIYLMHWLVVVYIMEHWGTWQRAFPQPSLTFALMLLVTITATLLLSTLVYHSIELPFIRYATRILTRKKTQVDQS